MSETGSSEHEANGTTDKSAPTPYPRIDVVDGVTGLTPDMLRSPNWDSQMGEIKCQSCGATWPCHYKPWTQGSRNCTRCKARDSLEWGPA